MFETNKVGRNSIGNYIVSTVEVFDREEDTFETALLFNDKTKVVETYDTIEKAKKGHEKWVKKAKNLKTSQYIELKDVGRDYGIFGLPSYNSLFGDYDE